MLTVCTVSGSYARRSVIIRTIAAVQLNARTVSQSDRKLRRKRQTNTREGTKINTIITVPLAGLTRGTYVYKKKRFASRVRDEYFFFFFLLILGALSLDGLINALNTVRVCFKNFIVFDGFPIVGQGTRHASRDTPVGRQTPRNVRFVIDCVYTSLLYAGNKCNDEHRHGYYRCARYAC